MPTEELDRQAYSRWQAIEAVMTPMDRVSDWVKYVIASYLYTRSRLFVPGRHYEDSDHGPLSAGGNAHADIMDLDVWLQQQSPEDKQTILDWMRDSSLEETAYWRGLRHRNQVKRKRDRVVEKYPKS